MTLDDDLFYPMNEFYKSAGVSLPSLCRVDESEVPEPYRGLLVHHRDMTPTLAEAYQCEMRLRILTRRLNDSVLAREIVLETDEGDRTVYAAIKIYLDLFGDEGRRLIIEGRMPFGSILQREGIVHCNRPQAFLRVIADETIERALGLTGHPVLYGRRSALLNSSQIALAQVLEILPPSAAC